MTRRKALQLASHGFGYLAFSAMAVADPAAGRAKPHFTPRAKNVIFLFMPGGVSHMESFDPKPKLAELDGKPAKLANYVAGPEPQVASAAVEVPAARPMRRSCQRTLSPHGEACG